jgi:hypothetical protein
VAYFFNNKTSFTQDFGSQFFILYKVYQMHEAEICLLATILKKKVVEKSNIRDLVHVLMKPADLVVISLFWAFSGLALLETTSP